MSESESTHQGDDHSATRPRESGPDDLARLLMQTVNTTRQPFVVLQADMTVDYANPAFYALFQATEPETLGHSFFAIGNGQWDIPPLRDLLCNVLPQDRKVEGFPVEHAFETIGFRSMLVDAQRLPRDGPLPDRILVAIDDVTQQQRLENELAAKLEFNEKLVDSLREAVLVLTSDLKVYAANHSFYDMFSVTPEATLGHYLYDLGNGQWNIPRLRQLLEEILPQQTTFDDYEVEHEFEDIGWRVVSLNARRMDHQALILLTIRDLTETVRGQTRLTESRERESIALKAADYGALQWDFNGKAADWQNARFFEILGCPPDQRPLSLSDFLDRIEAAEREQVRDALSRAQEAQEPFRFEARLDTTATAAPTYIGAYGQFQYDADGTAVGAIGVLADISARRHTEEALREMTATLESRVEMRTDELRREQNFTETLLQNQPLPLMVLDAEGRIVRFNAAAEAASGFGAGAMRGSEGWKELIPPEERAEVDQVLAAVFAGGPPAQHEHDWVCRYGTRRRLVWRYAGVGGTGRRPDYIIASGLDVTEQRQAEEQAREHLEAASHLQRVHTAGELAAQVAHELNQPLAAIVNFAEAGAELVRQGMPNPEQLLAILENIDRQGLRAGDSIRFIRDFTSREGFEMHPLNLCELARRARDLILPRARRAGIALIIDEQTPDLNVKGSEVHLEQVFLNLWHNAIEAILDAGMDSGTVTVRIIKAGDRVRVTVLDTGPGVDPDAAEYFFQPFTSTKEKGVGVGLSISRSLIEAHNGTIWVEPHMPGGIIHFELPLVT